MTNPAARAITIPIALAIAGCGTAAAGNPHAGRRPHSPPVVALAARQPLPAATLRRLPPGVFYLMSGDPSGLSYAVWKVNAAGGQHLIQPSGPGRDNGVREFSAAPAGVVGSVARTGIADLARLTGHGLYWLPYGKSAVHGFEPQVTGSGQLFYYTPPARHGDWSSGPAGPSPPHRESSTGSGDRSARSPSGPAARSPPGGSPSARRLGTRRRW
jgi:hypothetical protein